MEDNNLHQTQRNEEGLEGNKQTKLYGVSPDPHFQLFSSILNWSHYELLILILLQTRIVAVFSIYHFFWCGIAVSRLPFMKGCK